MPDLEVLAQVLMIGVKRRQYLQQLPNDDEAPHIRPVRGLARRLRVEALGMVVGFPIRGYVVLALQWCCAFVREWRVELPGHLRALRYSLVIDLQSTYVGL